MFGLSTDTGVSPLLYLNMEYAWYFDSTGTIQVYESGTSMGSFGAYTTSTILTITNDGFRVKYFKDGVNVYTSTSVPSSSVAYKFYSAYEATSQTSGLTNVTYAPMGPVATLSWTPVLCAL